VRFGDGEFEIIFGYDIPFHNATEKLTKKLYEILQSDEKDLLIGIANAINPEYLDKYTKDAKNFWNYYNELNKFKLYKLLNQSKQYYSASITRFYYDYINKSYIPEYLSKLKKIWDKKDIVIVEGEKSRLGIGNDLFDNTKSIQRIICPSENAFFLYDKILEETLKVSKKKLILLALGPTAKVLGYDLYKYGYQVIDVGHVDIEYEWYRMNAQRKLPVKNKYVNEARGDGGISNISDVEDVNYYKQIISKVL
jgi:glycosyltransferase family protein